MIDKNRMIAAETAQKMGEILLAAIVGEDMESTFKIGTEALASLVADFIDAIILNGYPERKLMLLDDITALLKLLLHVKNECRKHNPTEKH